MYYQISNEFLTVSAETLGAQLASIKNPEGTEYLWQGDPTFWRNRASILFPHVGRLTEGKYTFGGKTYEMPIHGFAKGMEFVGEQVSETEMWFHLESSPETREMYPFEFRFSVGYRLEGNALIQSYRVENCGDETMFYGLGGHPGFNVPMEDGLVFEDYQLEFAPDANITQVGLSATCFPNGEDVPYTPENNIVPLRHSCFDNDAIVLIEPGRRVKMGSPKGKRSVTAEYPDCTYLGLWHKPHSEAPYVCIEPWHSLPARQDVIEDLATQPSLLSLPAHETYLTAMIFSFT